ncbi:MAG: hypothetical protein ACR2IS_14760 [Nitrososphaeraceae archaeon]
MVSVPSSSAGSIGHSTRICSGIDFVATVVEVSWFSTSHVLALVSVQRLFLLRY